MSAADKPGAAVPAPVVEGAAIWLVTDVYPPGCGGSGWSTHALARTLHHRGHVVEVISIDPQADGVSQRVFDGIRVVEVGVRRSRRNPLRRLGAHDYAHHRVERYLSGRLRDERDVRILHAQHLHSGAPTVAAAAARGRASVQTLRDYWPVCLHGTSWWNGTECSGCTNGNLVGCMNEYWRWPRPLARLMVPWARRRLTARRAGIEAAGRVITVSDWVRQRIEPQAPAARYEVLANIVDVDETRSAAAAADAGDAPPEGTYLLAAGKLVATKGFDQMLAALDAAGNTAPVIIAGSGPESGPLQQQAAGLGFETIFPGWIAHSRLLRLVAGAKAFLLPSAWNEPLSRLLLEALALGTPVVTWRSGGNPEHLTDGVDAFVVDDADGLRAALAAIDDGERGEKVGAAGERLARQRFAPGAVYARLVEIYADAVAAADGVHR